MVASPLYTAPALERSAPTTAVVPFTAGVQPRIVPASVANRNRDAPLLPFWLIAKSLALPLNTVPVGAPAVAPPTATTPPPPTPTTGAKPIVFGSQMFSGRFGAVTFSGFNPDDQPQKLAMIHDLAQKVGSALKPPADEDRATEVDNVEALTKTAPPRVVALSSMGANRTSGLGMITALSLLEQGFRGLTFPIAFVRAGGFFENFLYGLQVAQGGTLPVYYNPTDRKSTMVATTDIGAEVATLLTGPAWSGQRIVELGSMVSADEVAAQLGEVLNLDVKAFAVPRAGWAQAFEQFGVPKGHTGPAEEMFEAVNAGWMDLGVEGTEHVAGTTSARDVFAAAQKAVTV